MYVLILLAMILTTAALLETSEPKEGYRDPLYPLYRNKDMLSPVHE